VISKIELRRRWREQFTPDLRLRAGIVLAALLVAVIALALAGCARAGHSTVPPQAKASASQIGHNIATGQAAQQAEGIVRHCATTRTGWLNIIACVAPHAPKGAHRKAFEHCGKLAIVADVPGQEVKFVQTDLPHCLVVNR
jgi:predicted small lipoprotein YifL